MKIKDIEIYWLGHAGFKIIINNKIIFIDPYKIKNKKDKADYILITHSHYDHLSIDDLKKIIKDGTTIIAPPDCQSSLMKLEAKLNLKVSMPKANFDFYDFSLECIEAYNINKHFHPRIHDWVGYIIKTKEIYIYHAGDTDVIPEQDILKKYAKKLIMLLPVGGVYTMNWKEAVELAKRINPYLVIPMHYAKIVGNKEDALNFIRELENNKIKAVMLDEE
ncbi:MAG: MBL fold metallo-hydrolase [Candidatus Pacearchaeota archaeon]